MSSLVGRQVSNPVPAGMAEVILRQTVGSDSAARRHVVDLGAWRLRWLPDTERLVVAAALVVAILGSFVFWRQFVARPEVPIHYFEEEYAYAQEISSFPVDHTVLSDLTYE